MSFGKKKTESVKFDQSNVSMLASQALAERRSSLVQLAFRVRGETPLLMNRWSNKAIGMMVGAMAGQKPPKEAKDLQEQFEGSHYRNEKGEPVIPCRILKASIIEGAIDTDGVTSKAELKRGLRVMGYTSPIRSKTPIEMDCRIVKVGMGKPDMRARSTIAAGYHFDVVLQFNTGLTPDKVVAAFEGAGNAIGICEFRPAKGGDFGTFSIEVLDQKEIPRILKECSSPEEEYKIPPEYLRAFKGAKAPTDMGRKALAVMGHVNGDAKKGKKAPVHANGVS